MKAKIFACSLTLALAALTGCSGSQSGINRSLGQADATRTLVNDNKLDASELFLQACCSQGPEGRR